VPALWLPGGSFSNVAPGTFIGVRVVAANGVNTDIYRFRLVNGTGNTAAISNATIGGKLVASGTPSNPLASYTGNSALNNAFTAAVAVPVVLDRAALLNPLIVSPEGSEKVTVRYGTSTANGTAPTNWTTTGSYSNFASGTYIGLEVTSEDFSVVRYYKFRVSLE
jgi:hypothetical protein